MNCEGEGGLLNGGRGDGITEEAECYDISPVVGIGTPPTPHPQASVPSPPFGTGGRGTLAGERGGGRVRIPTRGHTLWYSVSYMYFVDRMDHILGVTADGVVPKCITIYYHIPVTYKYFFFIHTKQSSISRLTISYNTPPPPTLLPIYLMTLHV